MLRPAAGRPPQNQSLIWVFLVAWVCFIVAKLFGIWCGRFRGCDSYFHASKPHPPQVHCIPPPIRKEETLVELPSCYISDECLFSIFQFTYRGGSRFLWRDSARPREVRRHAPTSVQGRGQDACPLFFYFTVI